MASRSAVLGWRSSGRDAPERMSSPQRRTAAWLAFALHAPGLWLWYRARLRPRLVRANLVAVGLTILATVLAAGFAPAGARLLAALGAWSLGHFAWSAFLARQ